jgi:hypothetical protein
MATSNSSALELASNRRSFTLAIRVAASVFPMWLGVLLLPGIDLLARGLLTAGILFSAGMVWLYARALDPNNRQAAQLRHDLARMGAATLMRHYGPSKELLTLLQQDQTSTEPEHTALPRRESGFRLL